MDTVVSPRLEIEPTPLSGLFRIQRKRMGDSRGWFERLFCADELLSAGWTGPIAQINCSYTANSGTVRGMHFQSPPHSEKKLVICTKGRVFDVAVDIRKGSSTFLKWQGEVLSPRTGKALLIPEGFAHGFQSLTDDVELLYCHSTFYAPDHEEGVHPQDPAVGIQWPDKIAVLSDRDRKRPFLGSAFEGVVS